MFTEPSNTSMLEVQLTNIFNVGHGFVKFCKNWNHYPSTEQKMSFTTVSFVTIEKPYKSTNIIKTINNIKHEFGLHEYLVTKLNCSRVELSDLELGLAKKRTLLRMKLICLIHNVECFIFDQSERMTLQVGLDGRDCLLERICDELLKEEAK
jgi:hypothetical protein